MDDEDDARQSAPERRVAGTRDEHVFKMLMSATFLARVMGMDHKRAQRLLDDCPEVRKARSKPLYDFRQAIRYLVPPKDKNLSDVLKDLGPNDLPESLRKDVWDARLKEQAWRERAGDLWHTEHVVEVFGEAFTMLASAMKLWADDIADEEDLPVPVREALRNRVDGLGAQLHRVLVEMPGKRRTPSQAAEHPEE